MHGDVLQLSLTGVNRLKDYDQINCIDIDSLIMRPRLIFLAVVENYQDYLIHDGITLANWPLAQMNGGYINFIKCDMSFITIKRNKMMNVS